MQFLVTITISWICSMNSPTVHYQIPEPCFLFLEVCPLKDYLIVPKQTYKQS